MPSIFKVQVFDKFGACIRTNMLFNMSRQQARHEALNTFYNTPNADYWSWESDEDDEPLYVD